MYSINKKIVKQIEENSLEFAKRKRAIGKFISPFRNEEKATPNSLTIEQGNRLTI